MKNQVIKVALQSSVGGFLVVSRKKIVVGPTPYWWGMTLTDRGCVYFQDEKGRYLQPCGQAISAKEILRSEVGADRGLLLQENGNNMEMKITFLSNGFVSFCSTEYKTRLSVIGSIKSRTPVCNRREDRIGKWEWFKIVTSEKVTTDDLIKNGEYEKNLDDQSDIIGIVTMLGNGWLHEFNST